MTETWKVVGAIVIGAFLASQFGAFFAEKQTELPSDRSSDTAADATDSTSSASSGTTSQQSSAPSGSREVSTADEAPCAGESGGGDGPPDPNATFDELSFAWDYDGASWEWRPALPTDWFDYYASRARPSGRDAYPVLATDPYDNVLISQIVCLIREAARTEGFSEFQTVEFTLAFVQSLEYVTDRAGLGFDEYPKFPVETLVDQRGDCEDTSILFASLVQELGYGSVLLLFDRTRDNPNIGHAAVGVAARGLPGTYWPYDGQRFYYVETTNSGWEIGQLPDAVRGLNAHVIPLVPQAILDTPQWDAPVYDSGTYRFDITVGNVGSADVEDVVVWAGWEAGNNRFWTPIKWSDGTDLPPGEAVEVQIWLERPPRAVYTKAVVRAWGSNAAMTESSSTQFWTG